MNISLGDQLIEDYKSALIMRSTAIYANEEAKKSEYETIKGLDAISRGSILNPSNVPVDLQNQITRASVDAHIKKVQAKQMNEDSKLQLQQMQIDLNQKYTNKKVKVNVQNRVFKPIESIWYDPNYKDYYNGILDTKGISGTVKEIMLDKNAILIKPNLLSRISASNRKYFMVYVINPEDLLPLVTFDFS